MPSGVYDRSKTQLPHTVPPEKRAQIIAEYKAGDTTYPKLAAKYKLHVSTIAKMIQKLQRTMNVAAPPAPAPSLPAAIPATELLDAKLPIGRKTGGGKFAHLVPEMHSLRAQGYSYTEIARKLTTDTQVLGSSTVGYYLHNREKRAVQSTSEGVSGNGHEQLDTRFLVGFGCAELERTLTAIAQRLGIAPNLLRQGFSKFLGSAAVR